MYLPKKKKKTVKYLAGALFFTMLFSNIFSTGAYAATTLTLDDINTLLDSSDTSVPGVDDPIGASDTGSAGTIAEKQQGPTVSITFSGEGSFQKGTKVTAVAVPGGFSDSSNINNLYFTWYLKKAGCDLKEDIDTTSEKEKNCDKDNDEDIDENDWKITATQIIIRGDFENSGVDYSSAPSGFKDGDAGAEAVPSVGEWEKTVYPDRDNDEDAPNCYVQDPKSGLIYELRKTEDVFDACPDGYHRACVKDHTASCDVLNPDYDTVDADPPKTIQNDFGACVVANETEDNSSKTDENMECTIDTEDDTKLKDFEASLECKNEDELPLCVKDDDENTDFPKDGINDFTSTDYASNPLLGTVFAKSATNNDMCSILAKPNSNIAPLAPPPEFLDNTQSLIFSADEKCSVVVEKVINGTKDVNDNVVKAGDSDLQPTCTFEKRENMCKHLFPMLPDTSGLDGAKTGDGEFSIAEKEFWGADPSTAKTNGKQTDEAAVMGLGIDRFSWTYAPGDMVGVAVEGTSMLPTDHADSSYRIMWAFSNGTCSALEDDLTSKSSIDEGRRSFYVESVNNSKVGILAAEFDLDNCLEENLLEPDDSGVADFSLDLSATPEENLINDPDTGRGDEVTVIAVPSNTENTGSLYYEWSIDKLGMTSAADVPGDDSNWITILNSTKDIPETEHSSVTGVGKSEFKFRLNIPKTIADSPSGGNVFYLRVKAKATESVGENSQISKGVKTLKIYQQKNQIVAYPVNAKTDGMLSLDKSGEPLCSQTEEEETTCGVTKNEIIGVTVPNSDSQNILANFSWKINGNEIQCNSSISSDCDTPAGNILFFPVLGEENEAVNVSVTAQNTDTGEHITVSKNFVIVKPAVSIAPIDDSIVWPKINGYYKDLNGNFYSDYSSTVYQSSPGYEVALQSLFYPSWKASQSEYDWYIDGELQQNLHNTSSIAFLAGKSKGESYNIELAVTYKPGAGEQINNLRKALLKNWGIVPEDVIEESDTASIQVELVSDPKAVTPETIDTAWGANLLSHMPEQFLFILRITLTAFVLLFAVGMLFSIMPDSFLQRRQI